MKLSEIWKNHKAFILCVVVVVLFFLGLMADNQFKIKKMKNDYEKEIAELNNLVQITNLGKPPELEIDIYESAEDFLLFYYGVSESLTADYRSERLKDLMTENAYRMYATTPYDTSLGYTVSITDIEVYVDYKNSSKENAKVCIFYKENTDWNAIDTISINKYWLGRFVYNPMSESWRVNEITECQELLTREAFDAFEIDTDISSIGGDENVENTEFEE